MVRSTLILLFFLSYNSWSKTIESIQHGVWSEPSTWSTNSIPQNSDSIFVHHEVVYGGIDLTLNDVHLEITVTGCLCGPNAQLVFHNSTLINDGHLAFIKCELHDNSVGVSGGTLLLTEYVLATSNSSMTITNGFIHITEENDLTCTCFDSTRYDSLMTLIDDDAIVNFNFEDYFNLNSDTLQICDGESITLHYDRDVSYLWSDGSTSNSITPEDESWLTIQMIQARDTVYDSIYVQKLENFSQVFPNIYTPNNDGINDKIIISKDHIVDFKMYNRWGKNVITYISSGLFLENINLADGDYYYTINVTSKCLEVPSEQKGWLQILR